MATTSTTNRLGPPARQTDVRRSPFGSPCHIRTGTALAPCHICTGTGPTPCHICTGTGLTPRNICTGTGLAPCHIRAGTGLSPATSAPGLGNAFPPARAQQGGMPGSSPRGESMCVGTYTAAVSNLAEVGEQYCKHARTHAEDPRASSHGRRSQSLMGRPAGVSKTQQRTRFNGHGYPPMSVSVRAAVDPSGARGS